MTRIILVAGKGGVGKTTVAAATALAAARRGYRTLAMSIDMAHSLSDCFDTGRRLFDQNHGLPSAVAENLDLQEIDVQEEIERNWSEIFRYVAQLLTSTGVDEVLAEEVAIVPGTEDILALTYLNKYVNEGTYDLIVLDAPPTAESLRFVNIYTTLEWYMRKRFKLDRGLVKIAGPLLEQLADVPMPSDGYFNGLQRLYRSLERVDQLLVDPSVTTVRLVTNAEKMVLRETQRAFMYFSLFGMTVDQVVVNRLRSDSNGAGGWATAQATHLEEIHRSFDPIPIVKLPMFGCEMVGLERLHDVSDALYGGDDPTATFAAAPPYEFARDAAGYVLRMPAPFADASAVDVTRVEGDVVVRVGSFKRSIPIPRALQRLRMAGARVGGGLLEVRFESANSAARTREGAARK